MEEYEKMLDEAYLKIKPVESHIDRFEIPEAEVIAEGTKTILVNFQQICSYLRRDCSHVEKYLQKELASSSKQVGNRLIFQRRLLIRDINEKIRSYVEKFVLCRECKKPDTQIERKDSYLFVHCLACGAKHSIPKY
jgi:translation initiation factor 2 subunit 2